jgi:3-deoxy-manno-octulosonate cytidylyltransferase (CMP-KDO synthetase)
MKVVAVIPAHLASVRFPRKVMYRIHGTPMIEHVRRRAMLCPDLADIYVATCDEEIADLIKSNGGKVVMTNNVHTNGTSRVAEAIRQIDCTHVVLLQADEPLLLPRHVGRLIDDIKANPKSDAWNVTAPIGHQSELDRHSFVKCVVSAHQQVMFCCRRTPFFSDFSEQKLFVRKILGIMAYRREVLSEVVLLPPALVEKAESIEQMRVIENGYIMRSVPVEESLPSVNEPHEAEAVENYLTSNPAQAELLQAIIGMPKDAK